MPKLYIRCPLALLVMFQFCIVTVPVWGEVFSPVTFTLDNGLQVVVIEDHRAPVVTHMVWYKVGSADERPGESGVAHFLEHLMFKGTEKFKSGEASKLISKNGGNENAFTSYDYTAFYQTVSPDKLGTVMDVESDRMVNLRIDEQDVIAERDVVLEERRTRTDNSDAALFREQVSAAIYLAYPYRIPIIGWAHEIKKLSKKTALDFYNRWYSPNNAILVVAGAVTKEDVKRLAQRYYGGIPAKNIENRKRVLEPPQIAPRRLTMESGQVGQPAWSRRYLAPSYIYGDTFHAYSLQVLTEIIGGGTSSRLYQSLVVRKKIAVSAGSWFGAENIGPSIFGFYASPSKSVTINDLEAAIDEEISLIINGGVTNKEVNAAITRLRRSAVFAKDSVTAPARIIGSALASGQSINDIENWPERIAQVSKESVMSAAKSVLVTKRSVTAILLPNSNDQKLQRKQ
jgi:zinc protease